jgi:hypothetical protein
MVCVIIAGSRDFSDYELLTKTLDEYFSNVTDDIVIISGKAHGADTLGERYAAEHGYQVWGYPAEWNKYGKAAGYIRNAEMAKTADALVAFWDGHSSGTAHMISTATQSGLSVHVMRYDIGAFFQWNKEG